MNQGAHALLGWAQDRWTRNADALGVVRRTREVAGLTVTFEFAGATLEPVVWPALERHAAGTTHDTAGGGAGLTIRMLDASEARLDLPALPDEAHDGGITHTQRAGPAADIRYRYHADLRVLQILDRPEREAWYVAADAAELPWWERGAPLRTTFGWWFAANDRLLLHGAAVGSPQGAVVLAGRGGSGKSSTALACLAAGMGYVGDDYCVLEPGCSGLPTIHALYGTAKVMPDQLEALPDLGCEILNPTRRPDDKVLLVPAASRPGQMVERAPIVAIAVPTLTAGSATTVEPLSAAAALAALAPSTILQAAGAGETEMRAMASTVRRVRVVRLALGSDRSAIPKAVEALTP